MYEKITTEINLEEIPVNALSSRTRIRLSCMLNKIKVLPSSDPERIPRDYRGFAHLMKISTLDGWLGDNPTMKLLQHCCPEHECDLNLKQLQNFFEKMDRYDVLDDTMEMFVHDAVEYKNNIHSPVPLHSPVNQFIDKEQNILTLDDIIRHKNGDGYQIYDAFILYVEADREFAEDIIKKMETDYNLKICDKDRDLIAGLTFEHAAIMKLIRERCHRLLVILSNEFVVSDRHTFFVKYAQAITFEQGDRKVIPCIYKPCDLPLEYRTYVSLDYQRISTVCNFWEKLFTSISPITHSILPTQNEIPNGVIIKELLSEGRDTTAEKESNVEKKFEKNQIAKLNGIQSNIYKENDVKNKLKSTENRRSHSIAKKVQRLFSGVKLKNKKNDKKQVVCAI